MSSTPTAQEVIAALAAPQQETPLEKSKVWDKAIENVLLKSAAGATIGGLSSLLLFRNRTSAAIVFGIGIGAGAGMALYENKMEFDRLNM